MLKKNGGVSVVYLLANDLTKQFHSQTHPSLSRRIFQNQDVNNSANSHLWALLLIYVLGYF